MILVHQIVFLLLGGFLCSPLALPLSDVISPEPDAEEPLILKSRSQDTTCPGRGGGYKSSGPYAAVPMVSEPRESYPSVPHLAAMPRKLTEDSIMVTSLEKYVRSKRHVEVSEEKPDVIDEATDILAGSTTATKTNASDVLSQVELAREVDLVFLVDVTGSMSPYIIGVRDSINDIVDDLLNSTVTEDYVEDLRLAFVGYRDFGDADEQFTILPFTDNVTEFRDFVAATQASGGANVPEDVFGGLDKSIKLKWGEPTRTRLIFHIADAPGHGCDLHLLASDDFPGGDPKERTARGLFDQIKDMDIQYYFGNITTDTDVMIEKFSEVYGSEIKTFDIGVSGSGAGFGAYGDVGSDGAHGYAAPMAARGIYESVKSAVEYSVKDKATGSKK